MTELEHSVFIQRAAKCLHNIKLFGLIEITRDDARYSATLARVKTDGMKIKFIPGLNFEEFCIWIRSSKESELIFRFFKVFERLIDTLGALRNRTNSIYNIMKEKK